MKKNMIFKILGILGGVFVIVSLFLPYIHVAKFSQSLWGIYLDNKQIYLSIVIILFGLLPVILYLLNKKIEYSYMSVGALLFFVLSQTISVISSNTFNTLSLGFYAMLLGTIMITITTFILDKEKKVKTLDEQLVPMSNNITNPLDRNGLDVSLNQNLPDQNLEGNVNVDSISDESQDQNLGIQPLSSDDGLVQPLGAEIPDENMEDGVNPVLAEFSVPKDVPDESIINDTVDTNQNINAIQEQAPISNPVETNQVQQTTEVPMQSQENIQPPIQDQSTTQMVSKPDIDFDTPLQTQSEKSDEPQFDIFGQPK